jgi:SAM-dependent methyltransferase
VLEVGCGTGCDSVLIARQIGERGELFASELSSGMLRLAAAKLAAATPRIELLLCNASHLPFADETFDAVFHFGGLNTFGEKARAIEEMTRVARVGGKVVVGDEGTAPWLREKPFGRILANANPLYEHVPPLELLPESARDVRLRWIIGNAFYVIDYRRGRGLPPLDLDLPIPGKGDSLRSRWERRRP